MKLLPSFLSRSGPPARRAKLEQITMNELGELVRGATGLGVAGLETGGSVRRALRNPDTFAAIRDASATLARLPLKLSVYENVNGKMRRTPAPETPGSRVLDRPGGSISRQMFWQFHVRGMLTNGRSLALIHRNNRGEPLNLQPRSAHDWTVKPVALGDEHGEQAGSLAFEYTGPKGDKWPHTDILDFVYDLEVDTTNKAISPAKYASRTRSLHSTGEEKIAAIYSFINAVFVKTGIMPNTDEKATFEERVAAFSTYLAMAQRKGYGIIPIGQDDEVDQRNVTTAQQNQLAELLAEISVQNSKFFATSPVLHGDARGSYRNAEGALLAFSKLNIAPLTNVIEQEVELKLLPTGQTARFDVQALLKGDPARDAQRLNMLRLGGNITANEVRDELGWDYIDDPLADVLCEPQSSGGSNLEPTDQPPNDEPAGSADNP